MILWSESIPRTRINLFNIFIPSVMAPVFDQVQTEWGINLSPEGEQLASSSSQSADKLKKYLLNADLRKVKAVSKLESHFPECAGKTGSIGGSEKYFVQSVKAVDITKPARMGEMFEEQRGGAAKRTMKVLITDGKQKFEVLERNSMKAFKSGAIAPGTKFMLQGPLNFRGGILLLDEDKTITFLGGKVDVLFEAWQQQKEVEETRALVKFEGKKQIDGHGPPQFIPFEKRGKIKIEKVVPLKSKEAQEAEKAAKELEKKGPRFDAKEFGEDVQVSTIKKDAFKQKEVVPKGKGKGKRGRRGKDVDEEAEAYTYDRHASGGGGLDLSAFVSGGNKSKNSTNNDDDVDSVEAAIRAVENFELSEKAAKKMQQADKNAGGIRVKNGKGGQGKGNKNDQYKNDKKQKNDSWGGGGGWGDSWNDHKPEKKTDHKKQGKGGGKNKDKKSGEKDWGKKNDTKQNGKGGNKKGKGGGKKQKSDSWGGGGGGGWDNSWG